MILFSDNIFFTALFWFAMAVIFAAIEVEIEGKHGWAEKTSTWFRTKELAAKLYGLAMGGRPLTGYHVFMFLLPIFILHAHFVMGVQWSLGQELIALAIYFVWMPTWDFLWFVLNPYYGVKKFKKQNVWWHARSHWLFNVTPLDYLVGWGVSLLLAFGAYRVTGTIEVFLSHVSLLVWFGIFTAGTIIFLGPLYRRWQTNMRRRDDRESSGIFYGDAH